MLRYSYSTLTFCPIAEICIIFKYAGSKGEVLIFRFADLFWQRFGRSLTILYVLLSWQHFWHIKLAEQLKYTTGAVSYLFCSLDNTVLYLSFLFNLISLYHPLPNSSELPNIFRNAIYLNDILKCLKTFDYLSLL